LNIKYRYYLGVHVFGGEMGRGKSRARETRVARNLKYSKSTIDLEKLATELHGEPNREVDDEDAVCDSVDELPKNK
jgi:hypothetical protein